MRFVKLLLVLLACQEAGAASPIDPADLEAYVDGVMVTSMKQHHVAGAVVTIVTPDQVLLSKGYGFQDVAAGIPVDPERTLFRIGSVSKLFVWLPVMQLVAEGRLDLDSDINAYLPEVSIPATRDAPITMAHLMSHTPGFEDVVIGLFRGSADSMVPLADIFRERMPRRVREPGRYASYSNHGVGLAGMVIENLSGRSWADYVDDNILAPLAMNNTTMHQPLPAALAADMARGYAWQAGDYAAQDFEYVPLGPAGGASAAATDMAVLLQMFLNDGRNGDARVLPAETARQMRQPLHRAAPTTNALLHGLYETSANGQLIMGHGGDTLWFHSEFMILPEAGIGYFISTNTATGPGVRADFRRALLKRYFPEPDAVQSDFEPADPARIAGTYQMIRYPHTSFLKLMQLLVPFEVAPAGAGRIVMSSPAVGEDPVYLQEVATGVYREPGEETQVTFDLSQPGPASHLYVDAMPVVALARATLASSPGFNFLILGMAVLSALWMLVVWTVARVTGSTWHEPAVARFRRSGVLLALLLVLLCLVLMSAVTDQQAVVFADRGDFWALYAVAWLVVLGALYCASRLPAVITTPGVSIPGKVGYALIAASGLGLAWFLDYWRLLGY